MRCLSLPSRLSSVHILLLFFSSSIPTEKTKHLAWYSKYQEGGTGRSHSPFPLVKTGNPFSAPFGMALEAQLNFRSWTFQSCPCILLLPRSSWLDCWGRERGKRKGRISLFAFSITHTVLGRNFQEIMRQWRYNFHTMAGGNVIKILPNTTPYGHMKFHSILHM